jgi:hypothetical protein
MIGPMPTTARHRSPGAVRFAGRVVALALILVGTAAAFWENARLRGGGDPVSMVHAFLVPVAFLVPGTVLLLRRDWHVVGWILAWLGVGSAFSLLGDWGAAGPDSPWLAYLVAVFQGSLFFATMVTLLVVFPDGLRGRSLRQLRLAVVVLTVAAVPVALDVLASEIVVEGMAVPNPLGFGFVPADVAEGSFLAVATALVAAFVALLARYRTATPVARRQYRWVLFAIAALIVSLAVGIVGSEITGRDDPWWYPILIVYVVMPVSVMVAILRYRLYEIDRIVTRTVTYSTLIALLIGLYAGAIALLSQALPGDSDLVVAAATLLAASVSAPLRRRVQGAVERRFNRSRFDAEAEAEAFARRLRVSTDVGVVTGDLSSVVSRTMEPSAVGMWVRSGV